MSGRDVRDFVESLLRDERPSSFQADDTDAVAMRTAIELRAERPGSGELGDGARSALRDRIAAQLATGTSAAAEPAEPAAPESGDKRFRSNRRGVIAGISAAAAAAAVGAGIDHKFVKGQTHYVQHAASSGTMEPVGGEWRPVVQGAQLPEGAMHAFEFGTTSGFVQRRNGELKAVSGVCTHQGCRLWFDGPADRLRCPCHSTSFAITGELVTHQLPVAPSPLPHFHVRESNGVVEVFVASDPA